MARTPELVSPLFASANNRRQGEDGGCATEHRHDDLSLHVFHANHFVPALATAASNDTTVTAALARTAICADFFIGVPLDSTKMWELSE